MHIPVMKNEVLDLLQIKPNQWYLDGTYGRGGHSEAILEQGANVIALDMDQKAVEAAQKKFATEIKEQRFYIVQSNFADLDQAINKVLKQITDQSAVVSNKNEKNTTSKDSGSSSSNTADSTNKFSADTKFAGALFDLGLSSNQLEESQRGFSFSGSEPLDMRMDTRLGVTAADLLNALPEKHLKDLFWNYAQETQASRIAQAITKQREVEPFVTTDQLVDVVTKVKGERRGKLHPATKVFMALRIAVNTELDNLEQLLNKVLQWLQPSARLVFISFHEGEDRQVKQRFQDWEQQGIINQVTSKPLFPSTKEVSQNPRSRSARVRAAEVK